MKTANSILIKSFMAAALLLLAPASRALTTDYMVGLSNQLSGYRDALAPSPAAEDQKKVRVFNRALKDLSKPTSTVAQDYDRFFLAVVHLGNYAFTDSILVAAGTQVSSNFIFDAASKIGELSARTNTLNEFVRTRKAAGKLIDQAFELLLINIVNAGDTSQTNLQASLFRGRRIFSKLVAAEKLVIKGEAHQGFAPTVLYVGSTLVHTDRGGEGTITIKESNEYEDANTEETLAGQYSHVRTGLNTGTLILTENGGGVNTVKVNFRTATTGTYTFRFEQGADRERGAGRFTFTAALPPG
jgi:hypothetical protein